MIDVTITRKTTAAKIYLAHWSKAKKEKNVEKVGHSCIRIGNKCRICISEVKVEELYSEADEIHHFTQMGILKGFLDNL